MPLSVSIVTFSPSTTISSSAVNSNFSNLNSATINADQLGGVAPSGFVQVGAVSSASPVVIGVGPTLPSPVPAKWSLFFKTPFS